MVDYLPLDPKALSKCEETGVRNCLFVIAAYIPTDHNLESTKDEPYHQLSNLRGACSVDTEV